MKVNNTGKTKVDRALLVPVFEADVPLVRSLIAAGADLNVCVPISNRAALSMPAGTGNKTPLGIAIAERANEAISLDFSVDEEPDARKREDEAKQKRAALLEIMKELLQAGADANLFSTSRLAKAPLFVAACNNDVEAVELLLRYGARSQGTRALHEAAIQGHIEVVKTLLSAGVDANEKIGDMTPIQMLKERAQSKDESEWELNLDPEEEQQEAEREKERVIRREQIMQILETHQMNKPPR